MDYRDKYNQRNIRIEERISGAEHTIKKILIGQKKNPLNPTNF